MTAPTANPATRRPFGRTSLAALIAAAAILAAAGAFFALRVGAHAPAPGLGGLTASQAIEQRYGVRVKMVGSTADGGLVDLRFVAVDADKALAMMTNVAKLPVMVAEDSGTLVNSTTLMIPPHNLIQGETYFLLYRNTQGSIRHGTPVTIKFGDLKLEHVIAQ